MGSPPSTGLRTDGSRTACAARNPAHTRPHALGGAAALLLVTVGICTALVTPWASSPLAAGSASSAHATEGCLEPDAETFPVRINVGTYRPPHPGPYGIPEQAPGPDNNNHVIDNFRYLVSLDNSGDPADPDPANHPGVHPMASSSPLLMEGVATGKTTLLRLPRHCRWLVTIQANVDEGPKRRGTSTSHKIWGTHVDLVDKPGPGYEPRDADLNGNVVKWVDEIPFPLPLGKLIVHVFSDTNPTNGAPDAPETATAGTDRAGLGNFLVVIRDVSGDIVTQNFHGDPICSEYDGRRKLTPGTGGRCLTGQDGTVVVPDLTPGRYEMELRSTSGAAKAGKAIAATALTLGMFTYIPGHKGFTVPFQVLAPDALSYLDSFESACVKVVADEFARQGVDHGVGPLGEIPRTDYLQRFGQYLRYNPERTLLTNEEEKDGVCPACLKAIPAGASACAHCDAPVPTSCTSCGRERKPDWLACPWCASRFDRSGQAAAT